MALDRNTPAKPDADDTDMANGTILLTAVQKRAPAPAPADKKKEDR